MLVGFYTSNWKSIINPVEFSMVATKEKQHGDRLTKNKKFQNRILSSAIMFGGNASGKSSFVQAFNFMRKFIIDWDDSFLNTELKPNVLLSTKDTPTTFEVDLLLDGFMYNYMFSCDSHRVVEERLIKANSRNEYILFHRKMNKIEFFDTKLNEREKQRNDIIAEATDDTKLFLTNSVDLKMKDYKTIYDWFKYQLVIIDPTIYFSRIKMYESEEILDLFNHILPLLDTGIKRLELEQITEAETNISKKRLLTILKKLSSSDSDEIKAGLYAHGTEFLYIDIKEDGEPKYSRLVAIHENPDATTFNLSMTEESDGTRRVLDLIPAFCNGAIGKKGRTFIIDEIDRSLHTDLSRYLYQIFFERRKAGCSDQIIATTHDQELMTQELFRRDEMWIFERKKDGTVLYSFADYIETRYDKDLRKSYQEGRMGGIPRLKRNIT